MATTLGIFRAVGVAVSTLNRSVEAVDQTVGTTALALHIGNLKVREQVVEMAGGLEGINQLNQQYGDVDVLMGKKNNS